MNKTECNQSDNSIDKSVARSSSGVSTQVSADGIIIDKESDCQILYGNLFSKFPHPEINGKPKSRNSSQRFFPNNDEFSGNDNSNVMFSTVDRKLSPTDQKDRRFSEAYLRSFNKRKHFEKRNSISNELSPGSASIDRLIATINDVLDCQTTVTDMSNKSTRLSRPHLSKGDIQRPIRSKITMGELHTKDLLDILIQKAETNPKDLFFSMLDGNGKIVSNCSLTYSKLYQRAKRISYYITTKLNNVSEGLNVRPGQSVGLVFPADDAMDFIIGFFACLFSKVIAVPVEKPSASQLSSSSLTGKYLNQLGISVILTNTSCMKEMTRKEADVKDLPQWKEMCFVTIDSYYNEKISKTFTLPESCSTFDAPLYVEYVYSDKHTLYGVPVSLDSTLHHCQALKTMCNYEEGQSILCTDDIRHQSGLWHCVLTTLYCGMSSMFMPFSVVKKSPVSWLNSITKHQIKFVVTSSRVLHHSLSVDKKDYSGFDLSRLTTLLVSDACVPWINETLDRFIQRYQTVGLQPDAVLPCVCKSETLTICIRRRDKATSLSSLKLCQETLSYGVIKDATTESVPIILESSGCLLPSMEAIVVKLSDTSIMCKEDEIGEICVKSPFSNRSFWMTPDEISAQYLSVKVKLPPSGEGDQEEKEIVYTRTGLVGFFRVHDEMDNIFIHGSLVNFIKINDRRINTDDVINTVSLVKPLGILHKARCCVFCVPVLDENRLVIVAEVSSDKFSDDKIYDWICSVLHAVLHLHQLNVYCIAGILPNTFPKTLLGDINVNDTMIRFLRGILNISHLTLCPQTAISSLPSIEKQPNLRETMTAAKLAHAMVKNPATISGVSIPPISENSNLPEILEWRATHTGNCNLFSMITPNKTEKVNCDQLFTKVKRVAALLKDKLKTLPIGSVVAIFLNNPLELTYAIHGCYYIGMVPLVLSMPSPDTPGLSFQLMENIWACKHAKAALCLTNTATIRSLKSRDYSCHVPTDFWPLLVDISETPKKKPLVSHKLDNPTKQLAMIRLYIDQCGMATLPAWTHAEINALCEAHKSQSDLSPSKDVVLCLDANSNTGILLHCLSPIYCGHHSCIVSPSIMTTNPDTWLFYLGRKRFELNADQKPILTFCSELALNQSLDCLRFDENCSFSKKPGLNLNLVESMVVCVRSRPNYGVIAEFLQKFQDDKFGLKTLSIGVDCPWTLGMFVQMPNGKLPDPIYLAKLNPRYASICFTDDLNESSMSVPKIGRPIPNSTVTVVDWKSYGQQDINRIGELWLTAEYSCKSILALATPKNIEDLYRDVLNVTILGCEGDTCDIYADNILSTKLSIGQDVQTLRARTGLLGFVTDHNDEQNQFVIMGKLDSLICLRGLKCFPIDIETCINDVESDIINQSLVFAESEMLVAVIEVREFTRLDSCFRLLPKLVKTIVENFSLPPAIIQFIKYGQISLDWNDNRRRIKTLWLNKKTDSLMQFYCL